MVIKRCTADREFSLYIRERDNWTCVKCKTQYPPNSAGLDCSHFHSRRKESVRFSNENCDSLCVACHFYFGGNPLEYVLWKQKQLGKTRFDALTVMANQYKKKDRKMALLTIRALRGKT